jgi:Na+/proline symporter
MKGHLSFSYIGNNLCLLGGVALFIGFFLPWFTFRINADSGSLLTRTINGDSILTQLPIGASSILVIPLFVLPPIMASIGTYAGVRSHQKHLSSEFWRGYWIIIALSAAAILIVIYGYDPFGLNPNTLWVAQHQPNPILEAGLFLMPSGFMALIIGGILR